MQCYANVDQRVWKLEEILALGETLEDVEVIVEVGILSFDVV